MEIKKLKAALAKAKVPEVFIEMPAIVERINKLYPSYKPEEILKEVEFYQDHIIIGKDKMIFGKIVGNKGAYIKLGKDTVLVDNFGMDYLAYSSEEEGILYNEIRRTELDTNITSETFETDFGNKVAIYPDRGDYDIRRNANDWETNKEYLLLHYPLTKGWFEIRERTRTVEHLKDENRRLKAENDSLRIENKKLKTSTSKLEDMLQDLLDKVKNGKLAKVFSKKGTDEISKDK